MLSFKNNEVKLFFAVWLVYLFFISGYGGNWMADSMLGLTINLGDSHKFSIDEYIKGNEDNSFFKGHYYSGFAPGASFVALPVYFIFKPLFYLIPETLFGYPHNQVKLILVNLIATIFVSSLLAALTSVMVYRFLGNFTKKEFTKVLVTLLLSFATLFFLYATTFDPRIISCFFSFLAFYLLFNMKKNKKYPASHLFFSGFILGFTVTLQYPQVIISLFLFIYLLTFLRDRKVLYFIFGASIPLLFLLAYHQAVFENPFANPYMYRASEYITKAYNEGMGIPTLHNLYELSFSPFRGLFFYMPVMLMSFYGIYRGFRLKKYRTELLLILAIFFAFFVYHASFKSDLVRSAGCSFGPRFLISILPFMVLPLAFIVDKVGKFFVLVLGSLSLFINLLPNLYGVTHLWAYRCMESNPLKFYLPFIFERGFSNYTLNLIREKMSAPSTLIINLIAISLFVLMMFVIYLIVRRR